MLHTTYESATIARATAHYGLTHLSTAVPKSKRNEELVRQLLMKHNAQFRANQILSSMVINQFVFIDHDGKLQVFTKPTSASTPDFDSIIMGSRSNDFDMCIPFSMSSDNATKTIICITTRKNATTYHWPTSPTCPITTEGPNPDIPPGAERIGMPFTSDDDQPVIVELPVLFPIPFGYTIPSSANISTTPSIDDETDFTPLSAWWSSMHHVYNYANAKSLTCVANNLFDPTIIDVSNFSNCSHDNDLGIEIDYIDPTDALGIDMLNIIRAFKYQICCNIVAHDPLPNLTPTQGNLPSVPPAATPSPTNLEAALKAAVRTSTDKEKDEDKEDTMGFYKILFGCTMKVFDIDTNETTTNFIPATLTPEFDQFLGTTKVARAITRYQDILSSYESSIANSDKTQDTNCHFTLDIFDSFHVTQIQNGNWASKPIVIEPMSPESLLGIHHFAPCNTASASYKTIQLSNMTALYQEQVGEDKSKIGAKRTKLFTNVNILSLHDIEKMISTFIGFVKACIIIDDNNTLPDLVSSLTMMAMIFRKEEARSYEQRCTNLPGIIFMLAQECQNILVSFVAEAKKMRTKRMIKNNETLPGSLFEVPLRNTKVYIQRVLDAMNTGDMSKYNIIPVTWTKLFNNETNQKYINDHNKKAIEDKPQQHHQQYRNSKNQTQAPPNSNPNKGLLEWKGVGKIPMPPGNFPHPRDPNQKTAACISFILKGRSCRYGKQCNFFHIHKPTDIPLPLRSNFCQWVETTKDISWIDGVTPPPSIQDERNLEYFIPDKSFLILHSDQKNRDINQNSLLPTKLYAPPYQHQSFHTTKDVQSDLGYPSCTALLETPEEVAIETLASIPVVDPFVMPQKCDEFSGRLTQKKRDAFVSKYLPTKVQLQLKNPFGKDNLTQCFSSETVFRHTWIPLIKSKYLSNSDRKRLGAAMPQFRTLLFCFRKYSKLDFSPLRKYNPRWNDEDSFIQDRIDQTSAALLHYDGDVASVIRYVGGAHTYEDIDAPTILQNLKNIISPDTWKDMHRVYMSGCPNKANIQDTEKNYSAFRKFGNHAPATDHAPFLRKALVKSSKRSLMLMADDTLADFCTNVKFSPLSVVDIDHRYRKPRTITDCSNRPEPWCSAINDWTSKNDEPKITFGTAFLRLIIWCYNLAISFPKVRKAAVRDDITNAFPRLKHNPNVAGMYSTSFDGYWCINTSQTFGENTSPPNFDITARAREEASIFRWRQPTVIHDASKYIPTFPPPKPMTQLELDEMASPTLDTINLGVLDKSGERKPPPFCHHVDDNMYGDLASQFARVLSASVLGAYDVFGYPNDSMSGPDPIEWTKVVSDISHIDEPIGYGIDLHKLIIYLPSPKRQKVGEILKPWITTMTHCTIRQAAELIGSLIHAAQTNHVIKARFFGLQNLFRYALRAQFYKVQAWYRRQNKLEYLRKRLPDSVMNRLSALASKEVAQVLWNSKTSLLIRDDIKTELQYIYKWITDESRAWEIPMGHIIPRCPTIISTGDASETALGAYCNDMSFWFGIIYGPELFALIKAGKVHINSLEFIAIILQLSAFICFIENNEMLSKYHYANPTLPTEPVLHILTDNQVSVNWASKITARSEGGQNLLELYSYLLLRSSSTKVVTSHISGAKNITADIISRPPQPFINPPPNHFTQIYQREPKLKLSNFFLPSPELMYNLSFLLRCEQKVTQIYLPQNLGQFSPAGATILYSVLK